VSGPVAAGVLFVVEFDAVAGGAAGASPTGFAGFTSSSGALRLTVGADFGGGPSSVSGVGVGVGATRRGRDDCALRDIAPMNVSATARRLKTNFSGLGIRFFIGWILSDFQQNLQTK
jgi:hypothetical protein